MRGPAVAMVGIAVLIGGGTVIGGRFYLERSNQRAAKTEVVTPAKPLNTSTVVVASMPLRFGMELSSAQLKEVQWPTDAVPAGSVSSIAAFLKSPEKRVVIAAMDPNEAILASKVTGPGERATLSAVIAAGMTAVTVPLSETQGVAGLVMPGDRVNLVFTRTVDKDQSFTDVLLQNVRVVAVDQIIDQRSEKPAAIRSATLEVMPQDAKRVALAGAVGSLSLMLRKAGEVSGGAMGRVTAKDLLSGGTQDSDTTASHGRRTTTVKVTRNGKTEDYTVLTDKTR
jgi:pilus assembly protein CpaB